MVLRLLSRSSLTTFPSLPPRTHHWGWEEEEEAEAEAEAEEQFHKVLDLATERLSASVRRTLPVTSCAGEEYN